MGWQWNGKQDVIFVFVLLFAVPTIGVIIATLFGTIVPFAIHFPVLFWVVTIGLFVLGFILVCKRAGKK